MADDRIYLAHKGADLAICIAKMGGCDWRQQGVTETWNTFMNFLLGELVVRPLEKESHAFFVGCQSKTDYFVLLREQTFNVTWTTPSGWLSCKDDYVNATKDDYGSPQIFRVSFMEALIREHRDRKS